MAEIDKRSNKQKRKGEQVSNDYNEGAKYVLMYLASLYSGLTETDIWAEFFPEDKEGGE